MWPVWVAQTENNEALIDSGLKGGEKIVVDGQYKLQPGSKVEFAGTDQKGGAPNVSRNGRGKGAPSPPPGS